MTQFHWRTCVQMSILTALTSILMACSDYQNARSAYAAGDYTKAYQLFQALAESGDTKAQYDLSLMYIQGIGTQKNIEQGLDNAPQLALHWFEKAAMAGSAVGQYNLAHMYMDGGQIAIDLPKAYIWMAISDATGNPLAISELAKLKADLSSQELVAAEEKVAAIKKTLPQ